MMTKNLFRGFSVLAALVVVLAELQKANGGKPAQQWVNEFAVVCQELVLEASINVPTDIGFNVDKFRAEAVAHVVDILADAHVSDRGAIDTN